MYSYISSKRLIQISQHCHDPKILHRLVAATAISEHRFEKHTTLHPNSRTPDRPPENKLNNSAIQELATWTRSESLQPEPYEPLFARGARLRCPSSLSSSLSRRRFVFASRGEPWSSYLKRPWSAGTRGERWTSSVCGSVCGRIMSWCWSGWSRIFYLFGLIPMLKQMSNWGLGFPCNKLASIRNFEDIIPIVVIPLIAINLIVDPLFSKVC